MKKLSRRTFSLLLLAVSTVLWSPPLGHPLEIERQFSLPGGHYQAGHRGIDLPAEEESVIRAPTDGTVSYVGTVVDRPLITIRVDERTVMTLEPVNSELREGDAVTRNQVIGEVAHGGHCEATCVHFGVRVDARYVNPLRFLWPKPELIPW